MLIGPELRQIDVSQSYSDMHRWACFFLNLHVVTPAPFDAQPLLWR
jgi:hypothetical protein